MAKRKRLTPVEIKSAEPATTQAPEVKSMGSNPLGVQSVITRRPPIAQVAGDAAAQAALEEVADELRTAKAEGRMVQSIALKDIDVDHLMRDRMVNDSDDMEVLKSSIKARGQQTPIDVVDLGQGGDAGGKRYGLISGWRRLKAFTELYEETEETQFCQIQCLIRPLDTISDAYVSMVEENEIRVGLSYYERARIAARAAEQGVYPTAQLAVRGLFASASRAKRSKIMSFLTIYDALDGVLRFPGALGERAGLSLSKALQDDPELAVRLEKALASGDPDSAAAEWAILAETLRPAPSAKPAKAPAEVVGGFKLETGKDRLVLSGAGVSDGLIAELKVWLRGRR